MSSTVVLGLPAKMDIIPFTRLLEMLPQMLFKQFLNSVSLLDYQLESYLQISL